MKSPIILANQIKNHTFAVQCPASMKTGHLKYTLRKYIRRINGRRAMLAAAVTAIAVAGSGAIWYLLFAYTPLGNALPMRLDSSIMDRYTQLAQRVDSMQQVSEIHSRYAENIRLLLMDSVNTDTVKIAKDTIASETPIDSLLAAGTAERLMVERFEASERFNLSVLTPIVAEGMVFFPPVSGVDLSSNSTAPEMPYTTIAAAGDTPVSTIYYGTVIDSYYQAGKGVTLTIQHPNGFISQYSGLADVFVAKSGKVESGQRIGMTGGNTPLTFTMWHNGSPLNPADYI